MAQNFIACDREQPFLLPPDVREWLPEDHLAWFVIDAVGVMDLSRFYAAYREDGHGRAAYEPSMMVALLLYCWAREVRSSRRIERACVEDVACRVIAAQQRPARSSRKPSRPTRPRRRPPATTAATSCPTSWPPSRAEKGGCGPRASG